MSSLPSTRYFTLEHWLEYISDYRQYGGRRPVLKSEYDPMIHFNVVLIPEKFEIDEVILALKLSE